MTDNDPRAAALVASDFQGDLTVTHVREKFIVIQSDERICLSLAVLAESAPGPGLTVYQDTIRLGSEPDSQVTYQIVGWDPVTASLLAVRLWPEPTQGESDV